MKDSCKNHFALIATILLCLLQAAGYAQNHAELNQLYAKLAASKADTTRVNILHDLCWQYVDIKQDSARYYNQQLKALSSQLDFASGMADALYLDGLICYYHSGIDSAELLYREALQLYEKAGRPDQSDNVWQAIGLVYRIRGEHQKSLGYFQKAIAVSRQYGHKARIARTLPKVANVYLVMNQFDKAIETYQQAREMYFEVKDTNSAIEALASIGYTYQSMKRYDTAIAIFRLAIKEFSKAQYFTYVPVAYTEIGKSFLLKENYDSALAYFKKAEQWYNRNDMQSHQDAQNNYMGETLVKLKRFSEAKPYLDKGLKLAEAEKDIQMTGEACWGLYEYYNAQGDYKNALVWHEKYADAKDSGERRMHFAQLADMTTKYETAKKDQQIAEQHVEINRKKYWLFSSFTLLFLSSLLAYNYYRRFKLKKEKQLQLEVMRQQDMAIKAVLEAEEKERKRIAGELHDGVGQMMSAARMNLSAFEYEIDNRDDDKKQKFEKIISLVDESCREVRTVSHNMMPNALLKSGLANAVRDFVEKIDGRVIKVDLYSEGLNERLDSNIETVLYRVIQECVNNVIKHSHADHLDISLVKQGGSITITIEDNGKGFDTSQAGNFEGIGLKNILTRIQYLKGEVEFNSEPGRGTFIAIYVPVQNNKNI